MKFKFIKIGDERMTDSFKVIDVKQIKDNPFKLIGSDWMLITAGTGRKFNTMTASWGGLGVLWKKDVCFCFVRPTRHTYNFMEESDCFTLAFFDEKYRDVLNFCGSKSGRDVDKIAATGITPIEETAGAVYFKEARLVLECKKLYFSDFDPKNFLDDDIHKNYQAKDYHRLYIGEIKRCLLKE